MEQVKKDQVKVGDLFYTSWGYDQTNYDYLIVVSVSKTGKTVKARMAGCENVGYETGVNIQKPVKEPFGDIFQMKVKASYFDKDDIMLRGSYPYLCDGKIIVDERGKHGLRLDTFSRVEEGRTYDETAIGYGH